MSDHSHAFTSGHDDEVGTNDGFASMLRSKSFPSQEHFGLRKMRSKSFARSEDGARHARVDDVGWSDDSGTARNTPTRNLRKNSVDDHTKLTQHAAHSRTKAFRGGFFENVDIAEEIAGHQFPRRIALDAEDKENLHFRVQAALNTSVNLLFNSLLILLVPLANVLQRSLSHLSSIALAILPYGITFLVLSTVAFNICRAAIDTVCLAPGSSFLFDHCGHIPVPSMEHFDSLHKLHLQLNEIQDLNTQNVALPMRLMHLHNVARSTESSVRYSALPEDSKSLVVTNLNVYWKLADRTSEGMTKFLLTLGSAIDDIIFQSQRTKDRLEKLHATQKMPEQKSQMLISGLAILFRGPTTITEPVRAEYVMHCRKIGAIVDDLVVESAGLMVGFTRMIRLQFDVHNHVVKAETDVQALQDQKLLPWLLQSSTESSRVASQFKVLNTVHEQFRVNVQVLQDINVKLAIIKHGLRRVQDGLKQPGRDMTSDLGQQIDTIERSVRTLDDGRARATAHEDATMAEINRQFAAKHAKLEW